MIADTNDIDDEPELSLPPREHFELGLREFRQARYFEAHDIWEDFWHGLRGPDRRFVQGLIHLAVGAYHYENGNHAGATSQWGKADTKLNEYPPGHWGVDTSAWLEWIVRYRRDKTADADLPTLTFEASGFPTHLTLARG